MELEINQIAHQKAVDILKKKYPKKFEQEDLHKISVKESGREYIILIVNKIL